MTQTNDAITFEDCKVELSANGSTWSDASGFGNSVAVSGGARQTGETYTFDGEFAIVRRGKAEPVEIEVKMVYTEGATDPYEVVKDAYEGGTDLYLRWTPKGTGAGLKQYTAQGIVVDPPYPQGEAGSGDPVLFSLRLKAGKIVEAVTI